MPESGIVKTYPNRRLYDSVQSRYLAMDHVRHLVVEGVEFRVVDAKSEADITRTTLLQSSWSRKRGAAHPERRVAVEAHPLLQ